MTKKQIKKIIDRLEKNPQTAMIDGETALKAINAVAKIAGKKNIPWALAGGVAMSYYGQSPTDEGCRYYLVADPGAR